MILIHKVLPNFGRVGEKCKLEQLMLVPLYSLISSNEITKMLLSWTCKAASTAQNWYAVSIMLASNPASVNFSQTRHGGTDECYSYTVIFVFWDFWLGNAVNWSNFSVYKWVNLWAGSKLLVPLFTKASNQSWKLLTGDIWVL